MGSIINSIILGIIQGLTEFLPVSSSGHLELAKHFLGEEITAEDSLLVTVVLHGATALSTIAVYRKEIFDLLKGLFSFKKNEETDFSLKIIISMIPAAVIGVLLEDQIESLFSGRILLVGIFLIITGILLFFTDRARNTGKKISYKNAFLIGIAQAIAILPGISRSGSTISTSVLLGADREKAARFSFLMVLPLILGKMAKDILSGDFSNSNIDFIALSAGFVAAFITGTLACLWMIKLVKKSKLIYFSIYCFCIAALAIIFR